ncbi:MAG TPA: M20/M25/M40 family metallo-hydrolase [Bryobacteraceae bacterium]|jgi:acetylornithine deacetylase/succinyl-diaminopimelate desuccinylase-like protein|nr:M20/M25/M40 family metallo-hydrolase [Bryobacteraceae bacterium]
MSKLALRLCVSASLVAAWLAAQTPAELMGRADIKAAFAAVERNEPRMIDLEARVCEIPAPPFHEEARGKEFARLFREAGLKDVHIDAAGNVIGVRPGKAAHPNLVLAAHLDTVFPEGTDVHVTREGTVLKGPGIGDDCRGLAVLMGVIHALGDAHVQTRGTITFVADVGEEGLGDLRGMKQLFGETLKGQIDEFISIDGTGLGVTNVGVGSNRYKVTFKGPGGHSYGAFGMANPIQAMGRAIARIDAFEVPSQPKTTFNVGRVGGGTSVNAIPFEAWMEVDMRSSDVAALKALDAKFHAALQEAVQEENRRWSGRGPVSFSAELVGMRPAGQTPRDSRIVETALAVSQAMGIPERLGEGSTDANVPMNLGIPAITISGGGAGTGAHSLHETFDTKDSWKGTERALLLAVALVE